MADYRCNHCGHVVQRDSACSSPATTLEVTTMTQHERSSAEARLTEGDLDTLHNAGLNLRAFQRGTIGRAHIEDVQRAIERVIASHLPDSTGVDNA